MTQPRTRAQRFAELADPPELRWRSDPIGWAVQRARVEVWSKQREILEAVRDEPRVAIRSCHSAGKSFTMGLLTCWWLDAFPIGEARVISTAPTSKQVDAVLWNEINGHHGRLGLRGHTNKREWYFGKFLAGLGRKPPDHVEAAFQGLHARFLLVLLDEAYGIPKHLWDEASSLASNENSRMVAVGNPDGSGEFEEICKPGSGWKVIHISYKHTPNFTGEPVSSRLREMLISEAWVEDRRRKWGEQSALFQSKCEGNFPTVGSPWQVIPPQWATQCRWLELPEDGEVEAGVDVGGGNDRTVVTVRRGPVVLHISEFIDPDPVQTVGQVALTLREWKVKTVKVDSIGIGWGLYGHLRALSRRHFPQSADVVHDANVVPINVSLPPTLGNEERFLNRRAEMWWDVGREHSRLRRWDFSRLPEELQDTLIHELTMPEYKILDSRGRVQIQAKKEIIEKFGVSPDVAESVLLAFVPASWSAEVGSVGLLAAPSLLESYGAGVDHDSRAGVMAASGVVAGRVPGAGGGAWWEQSLL